jgi:hypothetical protein
MKIVSIVPLILGNWVRNALLTGFIGLTDTEGAILLQ